MACPGTHWALWPGLGSWSPVICDQLSPPSSEIHVVLPYVNTLIRPPESTSTDSAENGGVAEEVAVTAIRASGIVTMIRHRDEEGCLRLRARTHQARARAGSARRSVGSARTREGPATRVQPWEASSAPVSVVFTSAKATPVTMIAARSARRGSSSASRAGATTSPATSLSLPVTKPGQVCLSRWSLINSTSTPATVTG